MAVHTNYEYTILRFSTSWYVTDPTAGVVDERELETAMNKLGQLGWELVGLQPAQASAARGGGGMAAFANVAPEYYFKRKVEKNTS